MRIALKVLAVAAGLLVLAVVAVAIAIATIDANAYAGPIKDRIKAITGRDFAAQRIGISASLTPRVILDGVSLGNAPWASAPQLLTARQLELQVALLPLLQRRLEIISLALTEPVIALETDADGRGNWEFGRAAPPATAVVTTADSTPAFAALGVNDLVATGGSVTFRDAGGMSIAVAIERITLAARDSQSPIAIDFRGKVDTVAVAAKGTLPPPDALRLRRGPWPVQLDGEVDGRKAAIATTIAVDNDSYRFDALELAWGPNKVTGSAAVATGGARPRVTVALAAGTLAVAELPAVPSATPAAAAPAPAKSSRVFGAEPVSFAALRRVDADGEVAVGELKLADGRRLDRVRARFTLRNGRLVAPAVEAAVYGGTTVTHLTIDAARDDATAIAVKLDAKGLDLSALLAAAGTRREIRGGKTSVALDVSMRGASPRQWVGTLDGNATVTVGPATLVNDKGEARLPLERLADLVNPFRAVDATTELQCAVARLPLKSGVARFERGIGVETKKLGVLASGVLDFREETIDVALKPRAKAGVPIDIIRLADLVRVGGTFAAPVVTVDAIGSVTTIARVGAAVATSGLSIVGESLLKGVTGGSAAECDVALGRAAGEAAKPTAARAPAAEAPHDITKAFGRLFGK